MKSVVNLHDIQILNLYTVVLANCGNERYN